MQSQKQTDWFSTQQQYWDGWFQSQRKAMEDSMKTFSGMQGQWNDFFKEWQNLTSVKSDQPNANMFQQMFAKTGENYIKMMEQFYQSTGQSKSPEDAAKDWIGTMQKFFEGMMQSNVKPFDPAAQWRGMMESMTHGGPAFWMQSFKNPFMGEKWDHQTANLFDPFGFYASLPGIGYTREKQEHANKLYRLWVEYEGEMRKYNTEMTKVGMMALNKFQEYLSNPPADAVPLESLKSIYVKWVDISEEVFAKYAMSDDYTKLYGEVVNALMAFKKQLHAVQDDMVEQFNLPTRAEVDSLHLRVQELRRDNIRLQKAVDELLKKAGVEKQPAAKTKKGKK